MKYIVANFKLNGNTQFFKSYFKEIKKYVKKPTNMMFAMPNCYLHLSKGLSNFIVGAQNISHKSSGACTGEISAEMARDLGAQFCLVGHSECRKRGETDNQIEQKLKLAKQNGLTSILCIGEALDEKPVFRQVLKRQLQVLENVGIDNIIIAYEPVWAIGTNKTATTRDIKSVHGFIKKFVLEKYGKDVPVLYGGSVNAINSRDILGLDVVDGVLVGGASLNALNFSSIYKSQL